MFVEQKTIIGSGYWSRLALCSVLLSAVEAKSAVLSLDAYLKQVKSANQQVQGAQATIEASQLRANSTDINTTPMLSTQITRQSDQRPPNSPFAGDQNDATVYNLTVQKVWDFGLQTQLSYSVNKVDIERKDVPPFLAPGVVNPLATLNDDNLKHFSEGRTQLDLSQPLWKNRFGREQDLLREHTQAKLEAQRLGEQYKVKALMAQAEFIYWQLALARDAVKAQEGTLSRFQKIRDWVQNRVKLSLADRADLLQADAGVKARRFELEISLRDRQSLQRSFNALRAQPGDSGQLILLPIDSQTLVEMSAEAESITRLDVEVAKALEKAAKSEVEQWREKWKPELNVFGSYAMNSRESEASKAASSAVKGEKPTVVIGLKFSTPLDQGLTNQERDGLIKASEAARFEREQKEFNARQEWNDLQQQLRDAKTRLALANEIETLQKQKLQYEKERLERGRTTTYQILLFEQDYANSQLGAIKAKADILGIIAKLKSFGDAV